MNQEWELKKEIVEIGKRIWMRGYVAANDGNISVVLNENELLTTPTGVSKGFMSVEMILKVDRTGKMISANSKYKPSSEIKMHLEVYKERPDIKSVVHAHPPYATSFAVAGIPLNKCVCRRQSLQSEQYQQRNMDSHPQRKFRMQYASISKTRM